MNENERGFRDTEGRWLVGLLCASIAAFVLVSLLQGASTFHFTEGDAANIKSSLTAGLVGVVFGGCAWLVLQQSWLDGTRLSTILVGGLLAGMFAYNTWLCRAWTLTVGRPFERTYTVGEAYLLGVRLGCGWSLGIVELPGRNRTQMGNVCVDRVLWDAVRQRGSYGVQVVFSGKESSMGILIEHRRLAEPNR